MNAYIELTGERMDIQDIQSGLNTIDWKITIEDDIFYLSSPELDNITITDNSELISKAEQFLDAANGVANILYPNHKPVGIGQIKVKNEKGEYNIFVFATASSQGRARVRGTLSTNQALSPQVRTTIDEWLEKANRHPNVRDVLHFFNTTTWWNLYKIYEIIRDDVGNNNLLTLISNAQLKQFTQAAQSRELLGDLARHASKKYKPPSNPLSLANAGKIIRTLCVNWIRLKN